MTDVKHKKCITCNLQQANSNYKDEQKLLYCKSCELENMIDVKHKNCIACNSAYPVYKYPTETKTILQIMQLRKYDKHCKKNVSHVI